MRKKRMTETQILKVLKEEESGVSIKDLARQHGVSEATIYNWKAKYGGMSSSELQRLKDLETEHARLKKLYANLSLEHDALKDGLEKKPWAQAKNWQR